MVIFFYDWFTTVRGQQHYSEKLMLCILSLVLVIFSSSVRSNNSDRWFTEFKQTATPQQLYNFLYLLPKGGDLHHHLGGSNFSEWCLGQLGSLFYA